MTKNTAMALKAKTAILEHERSFMVDVAILTAQKLRDSAPVDTGWLRANFHVYAEEPDQVALPELTNEEKVGHARLAESDAANAEFDLKGQFRTKTGVANKVPYAMHAMDEDLVQRASDEAVTEAVAVANAVKL